MTIENLQKGLLDWFWFEPNQLKPLHNIENVCIKIYEQYFPTKNGKNAKYEIFYPLIKYGVIEFYGNNRYGLSPSCALHNNKFYLLSNIPVGLMDSKNEIRVYRNNLGIQKFENCPTIFSFIKKLNIPNSRFLFSESLSKISSFEKIIDGWIEDRVIESENYYLFDTYNKWNSANKNLINGVYKKSIESYSQRTLKLSDTKWKAIPSREQNIDGFNIAVIWSQIQNSWNIGIEYYPTDERLIIKNIFFPLIIHRLLFINTLLESPVDFDALVNQYFINQRDFNSLNKLFNNKIETK